ncbi:hypothetical protein ASC87_00240 [Rhizobacter sp. Root1221]|nr:hypothetical protein ASC87_00240 [Rhizobacter sp. Root1221]
MLYPLSRRFNVMAAMTRLCSMNRSDVRQQPFETQSASARTKLLQTGSTWPRSFAIADCRVALHAAGVQPFIVAEAVRPPSPLQADGGLFGNWTRAMAVWVPTSALADVCDCGAGTPGWA